MIQPDSNLNRQSADGVVGPASTLQPTVADAELAQPRLLRHISAPGVLSRQISTQLMRRVSAVAARMSSLPIRRLQRLNAPDNSPGMPLAYAVPISSDASSKSGLRTGDTGITTVESGPIQSQLLASPSTLARAVGADQLAVPSGDAVTERYQTSSQVSLGTSIVQRHLGGPAERTIQRQAENSEAASLGGYRTLARQPESVPSNDRRFSAPLERSIQRLTANSHTTHLAGNQALTYQPDRSPPSGGTTATSQPVVVLARQAETREPGGLLNSGAAARIVQSIQRVTVNADEALPPASTRLSQPVVVLARQAEAWEPRGPIDRPAISSLADSIQREAVARSVVVPAAPQSVSNDLLAASSVEFFSNTVPRSVMRSIETVVPGRTIIHREAVLPYTPGAQRLARVTEQAGPNLTRATAPVLARLTDVSRDETPFVLSVAPVVIARQATTASPSGSTITAGDQSSGVPVSSAPTAPVTHGHNEIDMDELVEKALRQLAQRLAIEGERRGRPLWT